MRAPSSISSAFLPLAALAALTSLAALGCGASGGGSTADGGHGPDLPSFGDAGSGGSTPGDGEDGGSGGAGSAGVSLAVSSATSPGTLDDLPPTSGTVFFVVTLTMKNVGAPNALSVDPLLFSLRTTQALVVTASADATSTPCSPTVSVATGGEEQCQIAFEVPAGQTPATLLYDDQRGDTASASVPAIATATAACEVVGGWFGAGAAPTSACFGCVESAFGTNDAGTAACKAAARSYVETCGNACASCSSVGADLPPFGAAVCSCEASCDTAACHALYDAAVSCLQTACTSSCP